MNIIEFDQEYALQQLRRSRHPLRRLIKYFYLKNILCDVCGPTIDFGCGAGQLLARLPVGSIGLEVNPYLVQELQRVNLNVVLYNPDPDDQFSLHGLPRNYYKTLVMSHVLEHFDHANEALHQLCRSCDYLGIKRLILILPGIKGFKSDKTHKTFVDENYIKENGLFYCEDYKIIKTNYFPINLEFFGKYYAFHELKMVYERD